MAVKLAALAAVLALVGPVSAAIPEDLILERLGRERGFPSETITALYRDRAGFLWVGSREGLAVWDGYAVSIFEHEVGNADSLPDNSVRTVYEDRAGRLWVGTNSGGLASLDRATGRFEIFRHESKDPGSLSNDNVCSITEDADGTLWVGTEQGVNRFDPKARTFERIPGIGYAYGLKLDRAGRLWVADVNAGVWWIDPKTHSATRVPFVGAPESDPNVFGIAEDRTGTMWFGSERSLYRFDAATSSIRPREIPELAPGKDVPIVTSMALDPSGILWMSTWNRGLVAFDPATGASRGFRHDPQREGSLAADRLPFVLVDSGGDVWVATWGSGVNRFGTVGDLFRSELDLPYREVTSVHEDRAGRLWLGTWGKGLWRRDRGRAGFTGIAPPPEPPLALNTVLALAEESDGTIWAAAMAGLVRIDPRSGTPRAVGAPPPSATLVDRSGRLWVGTAGSGLVRMRPDGTFERFVSDPANPSSLSDNFVTHLLEGSDGTIWVGTRSGGLSALDPRTGRWLRFLPSTTDNATIGHQHISCVVESRKGIVWVGTDGGGVGRIERGPGGRYRVSRLTTDDGLVNQNVVSLVEDEDGTLWIGTRHGLSRFDPETGRFRNYGLGDGLPGVEFSPGAGIRGREGILFGTSRGLLVIRPGTPFSAPPVAPTVITGIRTLSGPMALSATPWETERIDVAYGTPLSFEFSVLDFRSPHRFAYRLQGKSDAWTDLGTSRVIAFTDLPPGDYAMTVRGRSAQGAWSETSHALTIRVIPPVWMTWWFRLGGAFAAVGVVGAFFWVRDRRLARRNRELEALQAQREQALTEARASQRELHDTYDRLRALTRQLEDAKEEEKRRIARELHDEMGQILSAIKINLKALGRMPGATAVHGERIADSVALVDEIIGQVREMALDLRPPLLDELGLVAALRGYAEGQSMRTGVEISVGANTDAERVRPETAIAAFRIVQEAVHNTLRHAGARRVTVAVRRDPTRLQLSVHDDGRGFDVEEALRRAATGRHLGLRGMRERVEALGGKLEIDSSPGHGTEIRASMPLEQEAEP